MSDALQENFIQEAALNYLSRDHYRSCGKGVPYANTEEFTIKGFRADGIIAFVHKWDKIYVASLEAKSAKTLANLIAQLDSTKIFHGGFIASVIVIILGLSYLYVYLPKQTLEPLWGLALGLIMFTLITGFTWLFNRFPISLFTSVGVLKQLQKYPANERWVAIGADSIREKAVYRKFRKRCIRAGVGLLVVSRNGTVSIESLPNPKYESIKQDFLAHYKRGANIRNDLFASAGKGFWKARLTKAQFNQRRNQYAWIVTISVLTPIILGWLDTPSRRIPEVYQFKTPNPTHHQEPILEKPETQELPAEIKPEEEKSNCIVKKKLKGKNYILKDSFWENEADAESRVRQLINDGFGQADYLWLPCYRSNISEESFCVYVFSPEKNEEKARFYLKRFREIAFSEKLVIYKPEILEIEYIK